ncbi:putative ATP-dependent RNA helicase TDRD12 isoform 2-T4 [Sarcophilus harrisii]
MIEVFILKIEDPGCFWVIIKGCDNFLDHEMEYQKLNIQMNTFYNSIYKDVEKVKPLLLEEGQACVVYCQELKCWCRAVIKSIMSSADHYLAECFLVDFAKYIPVKSKNIRVAVDAFMQLPYRAKKFRLYCTKPVTLHIDFCEDNAEIVPAKKWDSAAIQYFQNILKATTQIEAKLCGMEEDIFDVYLYVTIKNEKVCVNDDLVAKNFACYVTPKEKKIDCPEKATPKSLESPPDKINPALALWPMLLQEKIPEKLEKSVVLKRNGLSLDLSSKKINEKIENIYKEKECISLKEINNITVAASAYCPRKGGITIYAEPDVRAESSCQKFNEKQFKLTLKKKYDEKNGCVKLLQFLNPDPLKTDGIHDMQQLQKSKSSIPQPSVVLRNKIEPCSFETAPLSVDLKKPLAVIVCPGWKKAQHIFELLEEYGRCSRPLHPMLLIIGLNKEEAQNTKFQRGCEVIITTPHSLLRLLKYHSLLFLRLCHLIFDEIEVLFFEAGEQMLTILDYFKKTIIIEERESAPHQIVAVGAHWSKHIELLTKEFMNDPYIVITAMEEAALYGNVQQIVQLCLDCEKTSTLLRMLDFSPSHAQKTLIFTSNVAEAEIVCKVVESSSIFCLKMHTEIAANFKNVLEQWKKKLSLGSQIVLVLTDDCIPPLAITDATCVIHFSFPGSPKIFGGRLYCMSDNFQSLIEQGASSEQGNKRAKSVLLLTERSACCAVGVLRYLERTDAKIPPELCDFTAGVLEAKEDKKLRRPLCHCLKVSGFCKDKRICPDRHHINPEIDMPRKLSDQNLSTTGYVKIIPFYIVNATNYFGRIVDKHKDLYAVLNMEMKEHFKESSNKMSVEKVEKFSLYGLYEKGVFHRVQVLEMSPKEENCVFFNVHIKFIDEGRTSDTKNHQLLHLPQRFQNLPPQAVEFIVCRVKPIDNEIEWNPKVTRYIHHKIIGKLHEAKVVLSLGNTVWVDPMVHLTKLSDLKTSVIEYNVRAEILSMGMGTDNPEHIDQLKKLCQESKMVALQENTFQTIIAPLTSSKSREDTGGLQNSISDDDRILENSVSLQVNTENSKSEMISESDGDNYIKETPQEQHKSFHPEIKWFQKDDVVIVKIRLRNVKDQKCKFFRERVVFSAWVGDKFYLADMDLYASILKEESKCLIKNEEPIVTLVKEKKESWHNLLKKRNPNVSFDFDHWEECEDISPFSNVVCSRKILNAGMQISEDMDDSSEDSETESE